LRTVDSGYVRHDAILVQRMHRWNPVNESFHTVCKKNAQRGVAWKIG